MYQIIYDVAVELHVIRQNLLSAISNFVISKEAHPQVG